MKIAVIIVVAVLIICGTICVITPLAYDAYRDHLTSVLLRQEGTRSVTFAANRGESSMKWVSTLTGIVMIAGGITMLSRVSRERPSPPQGG